MHYYLGIRGVVVTTPEKTMCCSHVKNYLLHLTNQYIIKKMTA